MSNHTDCILFRTQHNEFFKLFTNVDKMPYFKWKSKKGLIFVSRQWKWGAVILYLVCFFGGGGSQNLPVVVGSVKPQYIKVGAGLHNKVYASRLLIPLNPCLLTAGSWALAMGERNDAADRAYVWVVKKHS